MTENKDTESSDRTEVPEDHDSKVSDNPEVPVAGYIYYVNTHKTPEYVSTMDKDGKIFIIG